MKRIDFTGKYDWMHDGSTVNGDISLHGNGDVTCDCAWGGGHW